MWPARVILVRQLDGRLRKRNGPLMMAVLLAVLAFALAANAAVAFPAISRLAEPTGTARH
jgi:hypothetical protein